MTFGGDIATMYPNCDEGVLKLLSSVREKESSAASSFQFRFQSAFPPEQLPETVTVSRADVDDALSQTKEPVYTGNWVVPRSLCSVPLWDGAFFGSIENFVSVEQKRTPQDAYLREAEYAAGTFGF